MKVTGTGSTLIVLVFSVLCLTIFSLISLSAANIDKAMADAKVQMVEGYYKADLLAEFVLAGILEADELPTSVEEINILPIDGGAAFTCPISDNKELYVEIAITGDSYDIITWRMRDTDEWNTDDKLPVWGGD